jgi:cell wall-associated NlpC family hydrolase
MLVSVTAMSAAPAWADNASGGASASQQAQQQGQAQDQTGSTDASEGSGGQEYGAPNPAATVTVDGSVAKLLPSGMAAAPALAPPEVQQAIWAANEIVGRPYVWGGGHNRTFRSAGYDCSGTVSYALHGGSLLRAPLDSSSFMHWGDPGAGQWITIYTNPGHAFAVIAGLRLDTSAAGDRSGLKGPRWRPVLRSTRGFHRRHPDGF